MTRPKMLPNARETALRHVQRIRADLASKAIRVPDNYIAQKAAEYVGATAGDVLKWMRGK